MDSNKEPTVPEIHEIRLGGENVSLISLFYLQEFEFGGIPGFSMPEQVFCFTPSTRCLGVPEGLWAFAPTAAVYHLGSPTLLQPSLQPGRRWLRRSKSGRCFSECQGHLYLPWTPEGSGYQEASARIGRHWVRPQDPEQGLAAAVTHTQTQLLRFCSPSSPCS